MFYRANLLKFIQKNLKLIIFNTQLKLPGTGPYLRSAFFVYQLL